MSYRYYANKQNPLALWMMDDSSPYQEYSGRGLVAATKSGTAANAVASSVVSSAIFSSVFSSTAQAEYNSPVFIQGKEKDPFVLEAWLYPIMKSTGYESQKYRENLAIQPSAEGATTLWTNRWFGGTGGGTNVVSAAGAIIGSLGFRKTWTSGDPAGADVGMSYRLNGVVPGQAYTFSAYVRASWATTQHCFLEWRDVGGGLISTSDGVRTATTANSTQRVSISATAPTGTSYASFNFGPYPNTAVAIPVGATLDLDGVLIEKGSTLNPYFDGSYTGNEWAGTAHNSVSRTMTKVSRVNYALDPEATSYGSLINNVGAGTFDSVVDTTIFNSGTGSLKLTANASNSIGAKFMIPGNTGLVAGDVVRWSLWVRSSIAINSITAYWERLTPTYTGGIASNTYTIAANTWTQVTGQLTVSAAQAAAGNWGFGFFSNATVYAIGQSVWMDTGLIEINTSALGTFFSGGTSGAEWSGAANASPSYLLASSADQQVLSHNNAYDGLTVNGTKVAFTTEYLTSGKARVEYDMQTLKAVHAVGVHNGNKNELYINGTLVGSVELTDDQKNDQYIATDGKLYSGMTASSQNVAINGVAIYQFMSPDDIRAHFTAGRRFINQDKVVPGFNGVSVDLTGANEYMNAVWAEKAQFQEATINNVIISDTKVTPYFLNGTSQAGSWTVGAPIDSLGQTSIYGVAVDWSGSGITVDVSLDGVTWTAAKRGELVSIIAEGFNPTDKDLNVRVSFAGGRTDDYEYLDSLTVTGYNSNSITTQVTRPITATYPSLVRGNYEPMEYNDRNGVLLNGGRLNMVPDTALDAPAVRTVELWIKPTSPNYKILVPGTMYRNGALATSLPVGEWSLVHITTPNGVNINSLLPDPSFESGTAPYSSGSNGTVAVDTTRFHSGVQSMKITTTAAGSNITASGSLISNVLGADKIYASGWVYLDPANTGSGAGLRVTGTGQTLATNTLVTTKGQWVYTAFSVPTLGTTGTAILTLVNPNGAGDKVWWDDLQFSTSMDVSGDAIVGQMSFYPTVLTTTQMTAIHRSYTGYPIYRAVDAAAISLVEPASPVKIYAYDWSITGAGG